LAVDYLVKYFKPTIETVIDYTHFCSQYNVLKLRDVCMNFMTKHFGLLLWQSEQLNYNSLPEELRDSLQERAKLRSAEDFEAV
jgi:hypothetical protein